MHPDEAMRGAVQNVFDRFAEMGSTRSWESNADQRADVHGWRDRIDPIHAPFTPSVFAPTLIPSIHGPCSNVSSRSTAMPGRSAPWKRVARIGGSPGGTPAGCSPGGGPPDGGLPGGSEGGGPGGGGAVAGSPAKGAGVSGGPIHRPSLKTFRRGWSHTFASANKRKCDPRENPRMLAAREQHRG